MVHCETDRDAALAYALGFVCHFALDSTCHPYVEQFTRESGVTHCEIETEFDNMLLRRDGYDPLKFFTASHIHPSEQNAKAIAPFYEGISEQVALDSLKGMISVHRLLQASNPVKRWVVLTGMKVVANTTCCTALWQIRSRTRSAWRAASGWKNCMRGRFRWQKR